MLHKRAAERPTEPEHGITLWLIATFYHGSREDFKVMQTNCQQRAAEYMLSMVDPEYMRKLQCHWSFKHVIKILLCDASIPDGKPRWQNLHCPWWKAGWHAPCHKHSDVLPRCYTNWNHLAVGLTECCCWSGSSQAPLLAHWDPHLMFYPFPGCYRPQWQSGQQGDTVRVDGDTVCSKTAFMLRDSIYSNWLKIGLVFLSQGFLYQLYRNKQMHWSLE